MTNRCKFWHCGLRLCFYFDWKAFFFVYSLEWCKLWGYAWQPTGNGSLY